LTSLHVVAAAQLGPASERKSETVERIVDLIDQASAAGAGIVMFPELALSTYFAAEIHEDVLQFAEHEFPSPTTKPITEAAARGQISVIVPFAEYTDGVLYNSSAFIDPRGTVLGNFRKVHIPGYVEPDPTMPFQLFEKRYFAPGNLGFPLYPTSAGKVGIGICYDRRFPETYRSIMLAGGDIVCIGYNSPVVAAQNNREEAVELQEIALRAGAIANSVSIVAAGKAGVENGMPYSGASCVINHRGKIVAQATTDDDELVVGELDPEGAAKFRGTWRIEPNLRHDVYQQAIDLSQARLSAQQ
jgi:predicted amidohydrolase